MSWQAMHRVIVRGPDDDRLFRLLMVLADLADPAGRNASAGGRLLEERTRIPRSTLRAVLQRTVDDQWLVLARRGAPRRRAVYNLGPRLGYGRVTGEIPPAAGETPTQVRPDTGETSAQVRPRTKQQFWTGPESHTCDGSGRPPDGANRHLSGQNRYVAPPTTAPVENDAAQRVDWARRWLERHPDRPPTTPPAGADIVPLPRKEPPPDAS